jgi:hypothetical protein
VLSQLYLYKSMPVMLHYFAKRRLQWEMLSTFMKPGPRQYGFPLALCTESSLG